MNLSTWFLAFFLALLSLHLGLSMELPFVIWTGTACSVLGACKLIHVERPTWGLLFVLFATGIFIGNQVLEDWALEGSWPQDNGLGAGFLLSLLIYLLWLLMARPAQSLDTAPVERDTQTILAWGLLTILLMEPTASAMIEILDVQVAPIALGAILVASIILIADRCAGALWSRVALMLPLLLVVPAMMLVLQAGQGPVLGALGDMFPRSQNFTPTGFSPNQQLRASVFLRPSTRAVMRIQADAPPTAYLAGNRLAVLDQDLVWQPSQRPLLSYNVFDAEILASGDNRYAIANHQANPSPMPARRLTVHSLTSDNYIFVTPDTNHIVGRFGSIVQNAADVWTPDFERGADRRWRLETGGVPTPDDVNPDYLQLPDFWDEPLQEKSEGFVGATTQATVTNLLAHFQQRPYALRTNFDPTQPFHDFYLNDQAGYCFWFATATALALRANGIPSRLVGGYVMHEQITSNIWLVRDRDAHSWVEWQDAEGYWHTIDPTPSSIFGFFDSYQSSALSVWYHALAGQWQIMLDTLLENQLTASLVSYGGLLILVFLFVREYRRIRGQRAALNNRTKQWAKLWARFLQISKLPAHSTWTATTYADNLPETWPAAWKLAVRDFLERYNQNRFGAGDEQTLADMHIALENCARVMATRKLQQRS